VHDLGIVPDTLAATRAALVQAAALADVVITSGGVSVGEEDHVKPAVEAEGSLNMWQLAIKPGKPLAFGSVRKAGAAGERTARFFGLPGNPVSSLITFLLFVRPCLLRLQGVQLVVPQSLPLRAAFEWPRADKRREYLRVRVNAEGEAELFANQNSAVLSSTVWGDGIVDNPPGNVIKRGDVLQYTAFSSLL
jgi:molybdopterin molybdotransferase